MFKEPLYELFQQHPFFETFCISVPLENKGAAETTSSFLPTIIISFTQSGGPRPPWRRRQGGTPLQMGGGPYDVFFFAQRI